MKPDDGRIMATLEKVLAYFERVGVAPPGSRERLKAMPRKCMSFYNIVFPL